LGEVHVKNFLPKKLRGKNLFPVVFPFDFFISFLAVSLYEELKNTTKKNPKSDLKNLKKSQKKYHGTYLAFFFFLNVPCHGTPTAAACSACPGVLPIPGEWPQKNEGGVYLAFLGVS
jgi:hypothetical protein